VASVKWQYLARHRGDNGETSVARIKAAWRDNARAVA